MDTWPITLTGVAADGDGTQLYPAWCSAGVAAGAAGDKRRPVDGMVAELHILGDGTNAGTLQLYDMNGDDEGAEVSSAAAVTNAQIVAGLAAGRARLIADIDIAGSDKIVTNLKNTTIMKGLVGRFVGSGSCTLTIQSSGIYQKIYSLG